MARPYKISERAKICYSYHGMLDIKWCHFINVYARAAGSDVHVSMYYVERDYSYEPRPGDVRHDWQMQLQRQQSNKTWSTIGTRTGYLTFDSPSHRTFTSVKGTSYPLRLVVRFTDHDYPNQPGTVAYYYSSWFYNSQ
mgnify:CR=1 FL=1